MLRITNIKMNLLHNDLDLINEIENILKTKIYNVKITSKSIDARNKNNIIYVYSVDFDANETIYSNIKKFKNLSIVQEYNYQQKIVENYKGKRPIIVGSGPAGMFAALILAQAKMKPIIIERGKNVDERSKDVYEFFKNSKLNPESNVQFGEGGAGTFSDGKLTTNTHNIRIKKVIEELIEAGANEKISYLSKPHLGTDELVKIVKNIRKKIEILGGEYKFNTKFIDFKEKDSKLKSIILKDLKKDYIYELDTNFMILAIGHSSRDTIRMLNDRNLKMSKKPFSIGVRIEHKQEFINKSQYGIFYKLLPPAEYKLNARTSNGRGVYTFCMCPGGVVVPASSSLRNLVINGMSYSKRDLENANSAVLVNVNPNDLPNDILSGFRFQELIEEKAFIMGGENYKAPVQLVKDYIKNIKSKKIGNVIPSYSIGYKLSNLNELFPDYINDTLREGFLKLNDKIKDFISDDTIITGVETRTSSPIRIDRDENFNSSIFGIIPSGEGAGYAGGIMSAAVDGIRAAESLLDKIENKG